MIPTSFQRCAATAAALLLIFHRAAAIDDGQALRPPMGWNSYNAYHGNINAARMRAAGDDLVRLGLKDKGYHYVFSDDGWSLPSRDASTGRLQADPAKFPGGFLPVADYLHALGLGAGI